VWILWDLRPADVAHLSTESSGSSCDFHSSVWQKVVWLMLSHVWRCHVWRGRAPMIMVCVSVAITIVLITSHSWCFFTQQSGGNLTTQPAWSWLWERGQVSVCQSVSLSVCLSICHVCQCDVSQCDVSQSANV